MSFSAREVAEMLDWPPSRVYGFVRSGIVDPERRGRTLQFGFRDLVVLRAAKALIDRQLAPARVREALKELARTLPRGRPLSAARLDAAGREVVIREHGVLWELTSGQGALAFENPEPGTTTASATAIESDADDWFNRGVDLEEHGDPAALDAYRRALRLDSQHCDAHVNIGRILQDRGDLAGGLHHYQRALAIESEHPVALFNAGTVYEDLDRVDDAIDAYRRAAANLTDARYNLARLYEATGRRTEAIAELKRLVRSPTTT